MLLQKSYDEYLSYHLYDNLTHIVMDYIGVCEIFFNDSESISVAYDSLIDIFTKINNDCTVDSININCYKVLNIKSNFKGLFKKVININGNIKCIGNMSCMFMNCTKLIKLGDTCDTREVINMSYMFRDACNFNQELKWDTSNVTNMAHMFNSAYNFNQELNWNTNNIEDMSYMFAYAFNFDKKLNWNTINVTNMSNMFYNAVSFNKQLIFDTRNVKDMSYMFCSAIKFDKELNFDTCNVTCMVSMLSNTYYTNNKIL